MAEKNDRPVPTDTPKKRKTNGRERHRAKKQRVSSHVTGENCHCSRFRCFEAISHEERQRVIDEFKTLYDTKNAQDAYLATLIAVGAVDRRRPRQNDDERHNPKTMSVNYTINVERDVCHPINVCFNAFCSIFGITKHRMETIRKALHSTGHPPQDGRGKHTNRPHKLAEAMNFTKEMPVCSITGDQLQKSVPRHQQSLRQFALTLRKICTYQTKLQTIFTIGGNLDFTLLTFMFYLRMKYIFIPMTRL
ncbi:vitamin B12-dependent ribonucleotide reductase [Plakobranchus ocellatus]|uniref:Vitamin B12-dependent ribonucleotide reductase n=1 Tax=Plakobranchus ocellatus TaxID=259542 RepID=A0AAV4AIG5_9GAST|nr:vitamin B12-dependent ribonucleotide reductase [Plakobranchus ocellatus]